MRSPEKDSLAGREEHLEHRAIGPMIILHWIQKVQSRTKVSQRGTPEGDEPQSEEATPEAE